ncbi:Wzz/FepE/Etk N-terminal domain-containing protein [Agarivorans gilvus]|uniref:LPS biosynthesis protein n=1 Tax=Agarivorans gilvus TaxID=680279 RepID=A0ABQ1I050_9ALTE|nr:Wzz/FepE/Etk N-terminal domain-containing protein [Agarivorans gilvus]GGA98813.1 LPS biosynthesis protein [Agarivorans gilvus]
MTNISIDTDATIYQQKQIINNEDVFDLSLIVEKLWAGKIVILLTALAFSLAATFYAIKLPNVYRSSVLLAPTENASDNLGGMASQLGGLASFAGLNLNGSNAIDKTTLSLEVLRSRLFISSFVEKHSLKADIMAPLLWDFDNGELIYNAELYDEKNGVWVRKVDFPLKAEPSNQEIHEVFLKNMLEVSKNKDTGLITLSISHISPIIAQLIVSELVVDINSTMKSRTIEETQNNINYLQTQLDKTAVSQMQNVFYQLIEEQTKTMMLAEANDSYVFSVVDPAVIPEIKSSPNRALICILGAILGIVLGIVLILLHGVFSYLKSLSKEGN